jgi:hypothetical protein
MPMKLPTRFRVRSMMTIVALVALGCGVAFELRNRAERDRLLRHQADRYRQAAIHHKRALECKVAEDRQVPYRPAERAKDLAADRVRSSMPPGGFRSWEDELGDHLYWGNRIYDEAVGSDQNLKAIEAKLFLP